MLLQRLSDTGLLGSLRELDQLRERFNHLLSLQESAHEYPALNVWVSDKAAIVESELPGLESDDIDISVVNDVLTIKGIRRQEPLSDTEKYHRQERAFGQFSRSLQLPFSVNSDAVEAHLKNGILQITLPRAEQDLPRKITVKSA